MQIDKSIPTYNLTHLALTIQQFKCFERLLEGKPPTVGNQDFRRAPFDLTAFSGLKAERG